MARNRAEASLNNARARQKQAEAQLEMANLDFKRSKQLYEEEAISTAEYEQSLTSYNTALAEKEAAEYSVQSAQATLNEADESLTKTSIYAPMTGTISVLNKELGEIALGSQFQEDVIMIEPYGSGSGSQ